MVQLVPMNAQEFDAFLERDIRQYAEEQTRAGFWSQVEALTRSRRAHRALLPDGRKSRYHHFYTIMEPSTGEPIGVVWLKSELDSSRATGFIFDLEIDEPHRRRGYARQAMQALENIAREMGLRQLGLSVFAHNLAARSLYEDLGYRVASMNMLKDLQDR